MKYISVIEEDTKLKRKVITKEISGSCYLLFHNSVILFVFLMPLHILIASANHCLCTFTTNMNCSFGNPRVAGPFLGHTMDRVVGEAQLYLSGYKRIMQWCSSKKTATK